MGSDVEFHYELTGRGWSECSIAIGGVRCEVTASYLSDALGELASAIEDLLRWSTDARAIFVEEPGEYRWRFIPTDGDHVRVKVIEFPHWGKRNDAAGKVIFDADCERRALAEAVVRELRRLWDAHGLRGYREKWVNHDFPEERLRAIEELLRQAG
jgi:hypothetical protein